MNHFIKFLLALVLLVVTAVTASSQGTVLFYNTQLSKVKYQEFLGMPVVDAPVGTRIGIFWGTNSCDLKLELPTVTVSAPGIFEGSRVYPLRGSMPGMPVYLKVAGWDGDVGDHWSNALHYGQSSVVETFGLGRTDGPGAVIYSSGDNPYRTHPFVIERVRYPQVITFAGLTEKTFGAASFELAASASSGLPVVFRSSDPSVATVSNSTVTILEAGVTTITASQAGDTNSLPAPEISRTLVVRPADAQVRLDELTVTYDGTGRRPLATTEPPGLPVALAFNSGPDPPTNAGSYDVVAKIQSRNWAGATNGVMVIEKAPQILTFAELPRLLLEGDALALGALASSSLPVTYASSDPLVARLSGNRVFPVGAGRAEITATQIGNKNFHAAPEICRTVHVDCQLEVVPATKGVIGIWPELAAFPGGSTVVLTAAAETGFGFIRWAGSLSGHENPVQLVMDGNKRVSAVFASLAVTVNADGRGAVLKEPDLPYYALGQEVTLRPMPERWRMLSRWTDGNTDNPRVVTVGEHNTYTAVFVPETPLETLTIGGVTREAPVGTPAIWVDGVFTVTSNLVARREAHILLTSTFPAVRMLYSLDGSEPHFGSVLYVGPFALRQSAIVRAVAYNEDFTQAAQSDPIRVQVLPGLTAETSGGGVVKVDPPTGAYAPDGTVQVTAVPAAGWEFLQWLGDAHGSQSGVTVTMDRARRLQAVFGTRVGDASVGGGTVVRRPVGGWYPHGEIVRFTAVPAAGRYFAFWADAGFGTNNPLSLQVTNAQPSVTAVFAPLSAGAFALAVVPDGFGQVDLRPRANRYRAGTNVVLTAWPAAGQAFMGWSGDANGTSNPLIVPMTQSRTIRARFTSRPRLTVVAFDGAVSRDELQVLVTGDYGAAYVVEATLAPGDPGWVAVGALTLPFGFAQYAEPLVGHFRQRTIRVLDY